MMITTCSKKVDVMKSILLVDDEKVFADGLKLLLEKHGYSVTTANNGEEGLNTFFSQSFDLLITDIRMPGNNGLQLISDIRKRNDRIKILAMSGGGYIPADDYLRISKLFGADRILATPFLFEQLLDEIKALLPN